MSNGAAGKRCPGGASVFTRWFAGAKRRQRVPLTRRPVRRSRSRTSGVRRVRFRTSPARPCWATVLSLSTPEWIDSQLHEPSDRLCCAPMFHHTAAGNAIQIDTAPCDALSGWFNAEPCAHVRPFSGHPKGHPIAFGHDLMGTTREIWKRGTESAPVSLYSSRPRRCVVRTGVIHR